MSKRNIGLDLLKVIACVGVVILHTTVGGFNTTESWDINAYLYYLGTFSIPLFFMINGYFLLNKKNLDYSYVLNKLKWIILSVIFWNFTIWIVKRDFAVNPLKRVAGSLIQRGYFFQFWFLGALIVIYLTLPLLKHYLRSQRRYIKVLLILTLIGLVFQISNILFQRALQFNVIQTFRLWTWYFYYIVGGFIGTLSSNELERLSGKIVKIVVLLAAVSSPVYLFLTAKYIHHNLYAEYFYDDIFIKMISIGLFIFLLNTKVQERFTSLLIYLSSLIMGVFIVHTYVMVIWRKVIGFNFDFSYVVFFIATLLLSFGISAILDKIPIVKRFIRL